MLAAAALHPRLWFGGTFPVVSVVGDSRVMVDGVAVNGQVSRISGLNTQRNSALLAARSDLCVANVQVSWSVPG